MAYNITLTNGSTLISGGLADGTIDNTNSSLTLVGKNYPGYGIFLNQNMVKLMENFANGSQPTAPLPGQLWWNTTTKYLNVNTATTKGTASAVWKTIATMTYASSFTTTPVPGEQWYDTTNGQLKVWNGSTWIVIGPAATTATGNSGAIPDTIAAVSPAATYVVLKFFIDSVLVGIWSKEASFTTAVSGFAQINRGLNLSTDLSQAYYGNADVALSLSVSGVKVPGTAFVRNDTSGIITGALTLSGPASDGGITFGQSADFVGSVSSGVVTLRNQTNNKDLVLSLKTGGVQTPFFKGNFQTGLAEAYANPSASSPALTLATKSYVDSVTGGGGTGVSTFGASLNPSANVTYTLGNTTNRWSNVFSESTLVGNIYVANIYLGGDMLPQANVSSNIGSPTLWFDTFYGVSVQAQYADLAERFETDQPYDAGTVVAIGGINEITAEQQELSEDVFGVISTRAAYLMNGAAGGNDTHPPVAVNGRVPVKVIGKIRKGDRLVSAGNGLARAGSKNEISPFNVIGRSLQDKLDSDEGIIEAIVKLNS
jgi:hypothetical protein